MINLDYIFDQMKENTHTIHAIVSPLASNDMANVLLSLDQAPFLAEYYNCLLYTSDAADDCCRV